MKTKQAKQLIIDAIAKQLEMKIANWVISDLHILGVKLGKMSPEQAAKEEIAAYDAQCTALFNAR